MGSHAVNGMDNNNLDNSGQVNHEEGQQVNGLAKDVSHLFLSSQSQPDKDGGSTLPIKTKLTLASKIWKLSHAHRRSLFVDPTLTNGEQTIVKQMKRNQWMLNKLMMINLRSQSRRFIRYFQDSELDDGVAAQIDQIAERAINEPMFTKVYAGFVFVIVNSRYVTIAPQFRVQIVKYCEKEFKKDYSQEIQKAEDEILVAPEDEKQSLRDELVETIFKIKRRSLGNIRFIGELYKLNLISMTAIIRCIETLLANPNDENCGYLIELLKIVGGKFEADLKFRDQEDETSPVKFMEDAITQIKDLVEDPTKLLLRTRLLLLNILDLQENDWKPRREEETTELTLEKALLVNRYVVTTPGQTGMDSNWRTPVLIQIPRSPPPQRDEMAGWRHNNDAENGSILQQVCDVSPTSISRARARGLPRPWGRGRVIQSPLN